MEKVFDEKKEITFENVDISISVNAQGAGDFEKTAKKNTKRRKILTTAVAAISSVALLTTATYAWFVLTNRPTVSEMSMKAGTSGNLKIANEAGGPYGTNISFTFTDANSETIVPVLKPVASQTGMVFYEPIYDNSGYVSAVKNTAISETNNANYFNSVESAGGQLIKKEFYIRADATDTTTEIGIRLMGKYSNSATDYTKIVDSENDTTAAEAVRISFTYGTQTTVLEPNADFNDTSGNNSNPIYNKTITNQYNPYDANGIGTVTYRTIRQSTDHTFQSDYASNTVTVDSDYGQAYSPELFTIPTNTNCKVTMYVWLEGTDENCTNAVEGNQLTSQFMFFSNDLS